MKTFHIQRIRSCVQCGKVLGLRCLGCVKHPDRQPVVLELYDYPEPIEIAKCGCCLRLACQRVGCVKTFWRYVKQHYRVEKTTAKTFFCSQSCAAIAVGRAKKTSQSVPCAYCGKTIEKSPSVIARSSDVYCKRECHYLSRKKKAFTEKQAEMQATDNPTEGNLWCEKCRSITLHEELNPNRANITGRYKCLTCETIRIAKTLAVH